jgi:hypothetical protein
MAWFGPTHLASMLFALFVLKSDVGNNDLIFDTAAIAIIASIVAHGLTDTIGAKWLAGRIRTDKGGPKCFVCYNPGMSDWQVERHDEEIRRLEKRLYAAEEKIRILERRPAEWLVKAEMTAMWILVAAFWIYGIVSK